jgi:hypothetical protein
MVLGPETKNDCTGEDQQKFTGLDWTGLSAYFAAACLYAILFDPEEGGNTFLRNNLLCTQNLFCNNIHYLISLILGPPSLQYGR